jgi:O-antigen biosynthesis protein
LKNYSTKISVVIVNYNVEYFLEQCLNSVLKALTYINGEVFVVDNNSIDGSVAMIKKKFPKIHLIENKENVGFSKANNQAIQISKGEYILLLNPDTVVEEDTFEKVIQFMDENSDAGGLGVRMLDGKGNFLPESKRGLPTPEVAFYKMFGLASIFPKSKRFGKYHLSYLSEFEIHEVDILSGAFMLMRKSVLDKVGLLDESFFMYGEDVDLSYRIVLGGYKNFYFPKTRIIHYKGESTKKSSVNYVFVFYRAMVIFAQKHFSKKNAKLFSFLINFAIYLRAGVTLFSNFIKKSTLPIFDYFYLLGGLMLLTRYWYQINIEFPQEVISYSIPRYTAIWLAMIYFIGGYEFPIKFWKILKGVLLGTTFILVVYALLPKDWQFSRLYILIGSAWVFFYYFISRIFLHFAIGKKFNISGSKNQHFLIVGTLEESKRVSKILNQLNLNSKTIFFVSSSNEKVDEQIGIISQLDQIVHAHKIDEIIFCARDTSAQKIIEWMSILNTNETDFKIAQPDSFSLIGSNSIDTAGDMYVLNVYQISKQNNIRNKRTLDFLVSVLFILFFPILIWFYSDKKNWFINIFSCLFGKQSFVGYLSFTNNENYHLPTIKKGILTPSDGVYTTDENTKTKLNLIYARDYSIYKDIEIIKKNWRKIDRKIV